MSESTAESNGRAKVTGDLPDGLVVKQLTPHRDERGEFTEVFREEWGLIGDLAQWGCAHSLAGVVRGVHVHPVHDDFFVLISGRMFAGLVDLRPESATSRAAACVEIDAREPAALIIPHGVAHGFYFPEPSTFVLGVTHSFDPADELGCRWDDPELGIPWPEIGDDAIVSPRDLELEPLSGLIEQLAGRSGG